MAWFIQLPQRLVAAVMAIGSGVLISAVAFDLMDEAYRRGGFDSTSLGVLGGAAVYTAANIALTRSRTRAMFKATIRTNSPAGVGQRRAGRAGIVVAHHGRKC